MSLIGSGGEDDTSNAVEKGRRRANGNELLWQPPRKASAVGRSSTQQGLFTHLPSAPLAVLIHLFLDSSAAFTRSLGSVKAQARWLAALAVPSLVAAKQWDPSPR